MSKNFAQSTVASPAPGAAGVSLTVRTGHGTRFYAGKAFVFPAGAVPSPDNAEVVLFGTPSGDTIPIARQQEGSAVRTIGVGDVVMQGISAGDWDALVAQDALAKAAVPSSLLAVSTAASGTLAAGTMSQVDASGGAKARTLPAASSVVAGTAVGVKKVDSSANAVTVSRAGTDTITGTAAGQTSRSLVLAGESIWLTSDGVSSWVVTTTDTPKASLDGTYATIALPANRTGVKRYNPELGLYNWRPDNTANWRTALARAKQGTAPAVLNCYGDSITWGQFGTVPWSDGWVGRLRTKVDAYMGVAGSSGVSWMLSTYRTQDPRLSFTGSWSDLPGYGPFRTSCITTADGSGATFIQFGPTTCDGFNIYYIQQTNVAAGAAKIAWSVDGGSVTNVSTGGGTENQAARLSVSAGTLGSHTLKVAANAGSIFIVGVEATVGNAGVRVSPVAMPGLQSGNLDDASQDGHCSFEYAYSIMQPHLSIYMFGSNEYAGQTALATYQSVLAGEIAMSRTYGDVLLVTTVPRDVVSPAIPQTSYHQVAYALADSLDLPVLDISARWSDSTTTPALLYQESAGSRIHPNNAGYRDIADAMFAAIMPR